MLVPESQALTLLAKNWRALDEFRQLVPTIDAYGSTFVKEVNVVQPEV